MEKKMENEMEIVIMLNKALSGPQFHILFLDWKQAFDKVDHSAMLIALKRLGVHPQYIAIIKDLDTDPSVCT